jgi:hypothetical protein
MASGEADKVSTSAMQRFIAAGIGAGVAEMLTLPIDAAKVRLQLQCSGASQPIRYTGLFQAMHRIGRDDGAAALWRGFQPALLRQVTYTGMSFVLYEPVRNAIAGDVPREEIPFIKRVLAGGTAGALSIIMMNPTEVVRTIGMPTASPHRASSLIEE